MGRDPQPGNAQAGEIKLADLCRRHGRKGTRLVWIGGAWGAIGAYQGPADFSGEVFARTRVPAARQSERSVAR